MPYNVLAADGDGTLLTKKKLEPSVAKALDRFRASGGNVILVTTERAEEIHGLADLAHFDLVVGENGALIFNPATRHERLLCEPPSERLKAALRAEGVDPLEEGRVIITMRVDQEAIVRSVVDRMEIATQIVRDRDYLYLSPTGVTKGTGLYAALEELQRKPAETIGIGDAESDVPLLEACGMAVAVANAVPSILPHAQWVTKSPEGTGVVEALERFAYQS